MSKEEETFDFHFISFHQKFFILIYYKRIDKTHLSILHRSWSRVWACAYNFCVSYVSRFACNRGHRVTCPALFVGRCIILPWFKIFTVYRSFQYPGCGTWWICRFNYHIGDLVNLKEIRSNNNDNNHWHNYW